VLQSAAVCGAVLHRVAPCCSVLQYVAVTLRLQELAEASERMGAGSVKRERLAVSRAVASAAARKDAGVL